MPAETMAALYPISLSLSRLLTVFCQIAAHKMGSDCGIASTDAFGRFDPFLIFRDELLHGTYRVGLYA
jgi:hypothetical protein